jgi:hypothetical protein
MIQSEFGRRAAVVSAFAEWQRGNARVARRSAPGYPLLRQMMPVSTAKALSSLGETPPGGVTPALARARRAAASALSHHQTSLRGRPAPWPEDQDSYRWGSRFRLAKAATPLEAPAISKHTASAEFNPDLQLTSALVDLTVEGSTKEETDGLWNALVGNADPVNWQVSGHEFFKRSERVPPFELLEIGKLGPIGWRGRLHEVFEWNWNPDNAARYENILGIDFDGNDEVVELQYWLIDCIATDLGIGLRSGGLDVDDGYYRLERTDETSIHISARKNLRYSEPQNGPEGFVTMLTYMAPTVLGLWLDQAVHEGVSELLRRQGGKSNG